LQFCYLFTLTFDKAAELLFDHSVFNGHSRFMGYITFSAASIGALGDVLAAAINPNVGSSQLAPMTTEIEVQELYRVVEKQPELQAFTQNLSIATFSDVR
jgi:hypothetical protein